MTSIKVPPLGESIVEAIVNRWLKQEGEAVSPGDVLVELETDKITVEVPAMSRGVLTKRLKSEGDVVKVGDALGEIDESAVAAGAATAGTEGQGTGDRGRGTESAAGAAAGGSASGSSAGAGAQGGASKAAATSDRSVSKSGDVGAGAGVAQKPVAGGEAAGGRDGVRASPAAARLASESNVDVAEVKGTGRGGVVSKPDVVEHVAAGGAAKASGGAGSGSGGENGTRETREKMSTRRKRIAEHLLESQHATAHLTTFNEIDMTAVEQLRGRLKERVEKEHGVRLSMMPFFVKAACMALESYPTVNAQIDGDAIVYKHYVNMGIAVASDAGLVVPNVKDADRKGLLDIGREISAVAKKARDGKLSMDDLTGGTFTITNGGVFGSLVSTPIINYPQVAILGLHKVQDRPMAIDGTVQIRPMMYVALSYDHRIIDGQQAVLFLVRVKELMEDPASMLVA